MDKNKEKKFMQSSITIICYVFAALMLVYACYQGGSTVNQINEYYASYGMDAKATEYVSYVFQAMLEPVFHAVVIFMAGYILNAVRKLDPKNYKTVAEIAEIEDAKKEAKDRKQAAKGEAKAAKAGHEASKEESVRADFTESLDAELKADEKAAKSGSRKSGQSRSRNGQSKSGQSKSGSKSGGSRKSSNAGKSKSQAPKKEEEKIEKEVKETPEVAEVKPENDVKPENEVFNEAVNESQENEI